MHISIDPCGSGGLDSKDRVSLLHNYNSVFEDSMRRIHRHDGTARDHQIPDGFRRWLLFRGFLGLFMLRRRLRADKRIKGKQLQDQNRENEQTSLEQVL